MNPLLMTFLKKIIRAIPPAIENLQRTLSELLKTLDTCSRGRCGNRRKVSIVELQVAQVLQFQSLQAINTD